MYELVKSVLACESFLIVTHTRPDGDAIGSQLAIGRFLEQRGKTVIFGGSDDTPSNLAWLDPERSIETFDGSPLQVVRFGEVDAVIVVDANSPTRLGRLETLVAGHGGKVFVIDHHPNPDDGFDAYAVDTTASSTGEIIYDLIASVDTDLIDENIAVCLYAAIMTDTGSFRYGNVTPHLMEVVADLFRRGAFTAEDVYNHIYKSRTEAGQRLLGHALQTLTLAANGRLAYLKVTRLMFDRTGSSSDDVDAFTDHLLAIEGVAVAILFMQVGNNVKKSFRSQGDIPVNKLAESFGGGGHRNASGAFLQGDIDTVIHRVIREANTIMPVHTAS